MPLKRGGAGPSLLSGIAILVLALILVAFAKPSGYPQAMNATAAVLALIAVIVLGSRVVRRR